MFRDSVKQVYREYHRDFRNGRGIRTSSTTDFMKWPKSRFLEYEPGRVSQLYTNQISPCYRAPHIYLGFPKRYIDRGWTESTRRLPNFEWRQLRGLVSTREGTALTEGMFMNSCHGENFHVWPEAFIRPGLRRKDNWFLWRQLSESGSDRDSFVVYRRRTRTLDVGYRKRPAGQ